MARMGEGRLKPRAAFLLCNLKPERDAELGAVRRRHLSVRALCVCARVAGALLA
jgi:hypothetical protein